MKNILIFIFISWCGASCQSGNSSESKEETNLGNNSRTMVDTQPADNNSNYADDLVKIFDVYRNANAANKDWAAIEKNLSSIKSKELKQAAAFILEWCKPNSNILSTAYLKKPDDSTLKAVYQIKMLKWLSFSPDQFDPKQSLGTLDLANISNSEYLASYYAFMFNKLASRPMQDDLSELNYNFEALNLATPEEKAIFFHTSLTAFSRKFNNSFRNKSDPCVNAKNIINKSPRYEGQDFGKYKVPAFADFNVNLNRQKPNASFKEYYGGIHSKVMENYGKCP